MTSFYLLFTIRVCQYNMFTGWCDCPLSTEGMEEAVDAGRLLAAAGLQVRPVRC
jgi:bisphosphoglycerate-dependent phosphoglycerate mutase